tara:strand:+ start:10495 stop:11544 length:1050 start_codon:yes stop_codon:yes gene_type:complete
MSYGIPTLRPGQKVSDVIGDPYTRSLYFGTRTTPGFINQLQQVARKRFAEPLPELKIADLTDLEQIGLDRLKGGIGGYERFLTSGEDQLSAIRGLQDPFAFRQFESPYQQAVIDQATEDAIKGFDMSENRRRFRDLQTGGESAFGSRARLGAQDRMEEFSRGLTKELAGLRQAGYQDSLQRVQDQINTRRNLFGDFRNLAADTQRLSQSGIQNIMNISSLPRRIDDARNLAAFNRATLQRNDPLAVMQALSQILPNYSPSTATVDSTYGRRPNPTAVGLGSFLNTFSQFMPNYNSFPRQPMEPNVYGQQPTVQNNQPNVQQNNQQEISAIPVPDIYRPLNNQNPNQTYY